MRRIILLLAFGLALGAVERAAAGPIDIAHTPFVRLPRGMTSMDVAIHGVRLGMPWEEARLALDRENIPYLFTKAVPLVVYVEPDNPTWYFTLNPASYEVEEMGICGIADLPRDNRLLADGGRWTLTTARTYFFGSQGEFIRNEEGSGYHYPDLGFVLKCVDGSGFRFVMVTPRDWPKKIPVFPPLAITVPFFVTGYWKPNSSANLAELRERKASGDLRGAGIINLKDAAYDELAREVDQTLQRMARAIETRLLELSAYFDDVSVVLTAVSGFADPRKPTGGRYTGPTVKTRSFIIPDGTPISGDQGNMTLSRLRAVYTARELESALAGSSVYQRFLAAGRLRWEPVGKGVADGSRDNASQRRAEIVMTVRWK